MTFFKKHILKNLKKPKKPKLINMRNLEDAENVGNKERVLEKWVREILYLAIALKIDLS